MKKYFFIILCLYASSAFAQFAVQGSGLTLVAGTVFNVNNLVLTPSANLTLTNQTITRSATPVPGTPTGASILQVHKFSAPITFSGTASVKYIAAELNGNTEALLQIAYNPLATGGVFVTTTGSTTGGAGSYYVSKSGLSNITLAQITATNGTNTLPLGLTSFKAEATTGCGVKINWSAEATGTGTFIVETSANGRDWHIAGSAVAAVPTRSAYELTDNHPATGTAYYRLKITDISGAVSYSDIAVVRLSCAPSIELSLSPNPARNVVVLRAVNGSISRAFITISDAAGKTVKTVIFSGTSLSVDIAGLAPGTYVVSCKNETIEASWKIIHQ